MKRRWPLLLFLLAGCTSHPIADTRDYFFPGRLGKGTVPPYGGVCHAQGPVAGPGGPGVTVCPPVAEGPPAPPVIPPPAPLPPPSTPPPAGVPPPPTFPSF